MIYLYVKRHKITGLKYFGKTTNVNPFKYSGSGKYWNKHLKKHGKDGLIETLEIWGFDCVQLCTEFALNFSKSNDIVKARHLSGQRNGKKIWANEIVENGKDGFPEGVKKSEDTIYKIQQSKLKNIDENGNNSFKRAGIKGAETRANKKGNSGLTIAKEISIKAGKTKKNTFLENGLSIAKNSAIFRINNMKNNIEPNGKTKLQNTLDKTHKTLKQNNQYKKIAEKSAETMKVIGDDGKTIYQKSSEKQRKTKYDKSVKYDVYHIDGNLKFKSLTPLELNKISPSLINTTKEKYLAKANHIKSKFKNLNKDYLIGLYVVPIS